MTIDTETKEVTPLELCILYVETEGTPFADRISERGEAQFVGITAALTRMVTFLTNVNTITEESEMLLARELQDAGRPDLAEAIALGGFAGVTAPAEVKG